MPRLAIFRKPLLNFQYRRVHNSACGRCPNARTSLYSVDSETLEVQKLGAVDFATLVEATADRVYWITTDDSFQPRVWISDGTRSGTQLLESIDGFQLDLFRSARRNKQFFGTLSIQPCFRKAGECNVSKEGQVTVLVSSANTLASLKLSKASGGFGGFGRRIGQRIRLAYGRYSIRNHADNGNCER